MIEQQPDKIFFLPGTDLFLKTSSQKKTLNLNQKGLFYVLSRCIVGE